MKEFPLIARLAAISLLGLLPACDRSESALAPDGDGTQADGGNVQVSLPEEISFNKHIQPILSEYCYQCHGPDAGTRFPEDEPLRLDRPEDAFQVREAIGKPVIIKGDPGASLIVELMRHKDPQMIMPPPEAHKTMDAAEIALLERWIEQGAEYEPHWSFAAVTRPEVPQAGAEWSDHPIDRFVFACMAEEGLKPNPADDPQRFHRRLALDTTGLPPAPEETAAFVAAYAKNPQAAVEAEAGRLLATTASAEHFARHWLDAARYADTHGIHVDNRRSIWPYRDWVIRAFESNMPWDQFTIEQIAGDLLPDRTLDQQVASGFNRCMPTTNEGGAIDDEYRALYALDQVDTTAAVWLGLTTSCAACHDHKFDPISTKEFYELTAFFRNTTMRTMDGNRADHAPVVNVPAGEDRQRWGEIGSELAAVEKQLVERSGQARPDFEKWAAAIVGKEPRGSDPTLSVHLPLADADGPLTGTVDGQPREWPADPKRIEGPLGKAAALVSDAPIDLGDIASFARGDQVTYGGFIRLEGTPTGAVIARMDPGQSHRGWDLYLQNGRPGAHVIDSWSQLATKSISAKPLKPGQWHHVMVVFDGKLYGGEEIAVFVDGERQSLETSNKTAGEDIEADVPLWLGARNGTDSKLSGSVALQDFRFYRRALAEAEIRQLANSSVIDEILALSADQRTPAQNAILLDHYLASHDPQTIALREQIAKLQSEEAAMQSRGAATLVMEEKPDSEAFAHVLIRGEYANKGERVTANTPAVLPPMPDDAPRNRLGLGRWLADPANPLPARVTMNRTWYYFFGTGIVESTEDFGIMGARPSHPELLDWLASEFVARDWNYRDMIQLIVSSATYRQSGEVSPEKLEQDPNNILLSRGPRIRLDAEQIRDLALAAAGSLVPDVGGPPVKPYQPQGVWEAVAMKNSDTRRYVEDKGDALYRRSIYTFWKRTAAPPSMEILNAPSRDVFCVRRDITNTPLQALVLLNDPQFVESSRMLATAAIKDSSAFDARLDFITLRLLSRILDGTERDIVRSNLDKTLATYAAEPKAASELIATGASPVPQGLDPAELAAWTLIASQIFNLDETVTR